MTNSLAPSRVAKFVSNLTNPALLVSVALVTVIYHFTDNNREFWIGSLVGVGLLVGPGLLYSASIWWKEGYVDVDLTNRQERIVPLMLSSLGAIIGAYLIQKNLHNQTFVEMAFILVTLLVALTVITTVWKISLHTAALSSLVSLLIIFRGEIFALGFLLLIPISWARITLRQHTRTQLIAGAALGVALTVSTAWFFRY